MPRISADMIAEAGQFTNALKDREIDLRGEQRDHATTVVSALFTRHYYFALRNVGCSTAR
jgi:hypothetical protein